MGENQNNPTSSQLLGSLARELRNPLTLIARQAELEAYSSREPSFQSIRATAENALKLIDSYLLIAQSEYGQNQLDLQTIGVGSIIYDAVEEFRPVANKHNVDLICHVRDQTIMTHSAGLKTALWCMFNLSLESIMEDKKSVKQITVSTKMSRDKNVAISVLSNLDVSPNDVSLSRKMQGRSHLALGSHAGSSGIHLALADLFANAAGKGLRPAKQGNMRGLMMSVAKSQQLQLI